MYISEVLQPNGKQQFDFSLVTTYKFNVHAHTHNNTRTRTQIHDPRKSTKDVRRIGNENENKKLITMNFDFSPVIANNNFGTLKEWIYSEYLKPTRIFS